MPKVMFDIPTEIALPFTPHGSNPLPSVPGSTFPAPAVIPPPSSDANIHPPKVPNPRTTPSVHIPSAPIPAIKPLDGKCARHPSTGFGTRDIKKIAVCSRTPHQMFHTITS